METTRLTRRTLMQSAAAAATLAGAPLAGAPFVRGAHAAGKLSVAVWDHWVPGANDVLEKLSREWAAKEKVELTIDFVTSQGDKLMLMGAAEGQARSGHDVVGQPSWYAAAKADMWEPADDLMATLIGKYGKPSAAVEYLGKQNGHWIAVPSIPNTLTLPSVGRIDLFKQYVGLDLTKMYPAGTPPDKELTDNWTWDFWLDAAGKLHKAGFPFGMPLGQTGNSMNWVGAIFAAHGAEMVDKDGNITVKSAATKHMLDFFKKLVPLLPDGVFAWDDSSNNKALISGQSALIMNPPSAWAVAVRDAPKVAEQCWHFPSPKGPKGALRPGAAFLLGDLEFFAQQIGRKEPAAASVGEGLRRAARRRQQGVRHPGLRNFARLQDLGRGGSAKGRHLELPAARRCDRVGVRLARADADRQPDFRPSDDDQDDRPIYSTREDHGPGDGLGRRRARRLQPVVTSRRGRGSAAVDCLATRTYSSTPQNCWRWM